MIIEKMSFGRELRVLGVYRKENAAKDVGFLCGLISTLSYYLQTRTPEVP